MKTILVPVDFSDCAVEVTETAASIAKAFSARILLIHVAAPEPEFIGYEPGPQSVRDTVARELVQEHKLLHAMDRQLEAKGLAVTSLVIQGYPVEKILEEAAKHQVDLIVMGSHGHGLLRNLLVGSVTEGVMRRSTCPVLVVPHRA